MSPDCVSDGQCLAVSSAQDELVQYDRALERRVVRKLDWHVVPLVAALCECHAHATIVSLNEQTDLLAFLDRSNIGNARIAGMEDDLRLGYGDRYTWLLTIFYISYILFEPLILSQSDSV